MPPSPSASSSAKPVVSVTATRRRLSASSLNGEEPGSIVVTNHWPDPGTSPRRTRGNSPARTTLDLPVPEPPTTSTSRAAQVVAAEPGEDLVDEVGTAEEVGGVGLVEGPQPLVRVRERLVAGGLGAGERGDEQRHELRHRRPAGRRHAAGQDVGNPRRRDAARHPSTSTAKSCTSSLAVRVGSIRAEGEVGEIGVAGSVEQHALRAHPAVHDPGVGRGHQRPADATDQRRQRVVRQRTAAQPVGQRPTVHPAHHQVGSARLPPVVVDRDDRRVAQRRHPMRAGLERPHELGAVGDLLPEDADREVALDPGQAGGEHGAVATRAQPLTQAVSAQRQPSGLGEHQRRVVGEDPLFELRQRRRRLEAELLDEHPAVVAEHAECVGLATGAVEGDHQLGSERLAQLVLTGERLDLRDHLRRSAARQLGLDETLVSDDPQLLQPLRLGTGPLLVGELGVGLAAPQRQRLAQHRRRPGRVAAPQPRTGVGDQALEAGHVERLARQPQHVPRRLRHHRRRRPVSVDHPAHPGHVAPQRRGSPRPSAHPRRPPRRAGPPTPRRCDGSAASPPAGADAAHRCSPHPRCR